MDTRILPSRIPTNPLLLNFERSRIPIIPHGIHRLAIHGIRSGVVGVTARPHVIISNMLVSPGDVVGLPPETMHPHARRPTRHAIGEICGFRVVGHGRLHVGEIVEIPIWICKRDIGTIADGRRVQSRGDDRCGRFWNQSLRIRVGFSSGNPLRFHSNRERSVDGAILWSGTQSVWEAANI